MGESRTITRNFPALVLLTRTDGSLPDAAGRAIRCFVRPETRFGIGPWHAGSAGGRDSPAAGIPGSGGRRPERLGPGGAPGRAAGWRIAGPGYRGARAERRAG